MNYKLLTVILSIIVSISTVHSAAAPYLPITGKFNVDGKGALNYKIPIELVPSLYQPHLSISYNSQSSNGYIGNGWSMQGTPLIRMCAMNIRQDNKWSNIMVNMGVDDYSVNRFCMGGKRLSVISGKYGEDKSTYQTELLSHSVITANGNCGSGPCSFTVKSSDGSVQAYGGNANTTVQLDNKDILIWGINTDTDKFSNLIQFSYVKSDGTNVLYPNDIKYFISKDKKNYRSVTFEYDAIAPTNKQVKKVGLGGYSFKPDKVLTKISTYDTGTVGVFVYEFSSTYNKFTDKYKLNSLGKKSADLSQEYFDHKFTYEDYQPGTPGFNAVNTINFPITVTDWDSVKVVIMDKYGDGYNGIGVISNENNHAVFSFARGDKDGKLTIADDRMDLGEFTPTTKNEDSYTYLSFDKNGDGLNDLIKIFKGSNEQTYAKTFLSQSGSPNFIEDKVIQPFYTPYIDSGAQKSTYVGRDINGDGLSDIIEMTPSTNDKLAKYTINVYYADVKGGFPTHDLINSQIQNSVIPTVDQSISFSDYDKDTLSDFFLLSADNGLVNATPLYNRQGKFLAPDGDTTEKIDLGSNGDWKGLPAYNFVDFNSDGLSDIVKFNFSSTQPITGNIYMNTGHMFGKMVEGSGVGNNTTQVFTLTTADEDENNAHHVTFADINGDGQPDILKYRGGDGDPKSPDETYFDTFIHTGNTFQQGKSTPVFGEHTRNIVSSMGDNPLASIITILQVPGSFNVTVNLNTLEPPKMEMIGIDNGMGLVYKVNYEKVSPFIDYKNIKQPDYPNILLSKIRMVVSSYAKAQDKGKPYGFERLHEYTYSFPIYNKHDWMFSGYSKVDEQIKSLDKLITRLYYVTYPIRGKIKSKTIGQLSTGAPFTSKSTTWGYKVKYPDADPKVVMVYKTGSSSITYQDSSSNAAAVSLQLDNVFQYSDEWGLNLWSMKSFVGGTPLYKCYRYANNESAKGAFIIGQKTGKLSTKSKSQCSAFSGIKAYDAEFKITPDDLSLSYFKLSDDGLLSTIAKLSYSSANKGYHTKQYSFNAMGQLVETITSLDYTPLTAVFPSKDNLLVTTNTFGDDGYINKTSLNKLDTISKTDSRFGIHYEQTSPSGTVSNHTLNSLGSVTANTVNGIKLSNTTYGNDDDGNFKMVTTFIGTGKGVDKTYLNASMKPWKKTAAMNSKDILTSGNILTNPDTGQVVTKFSNYFDQTKAKKIQVSYDNRWKKSKEVRDDQVNTFTRHYLQGKTSMEHHGNDPTHAVTSLVLLSTDISDPVNRIKTHVMADKTQSVSTSDLVGNIVNEVDYRGLVSTKTMDMDGKLLATSTPDSGVETFKWNSAGKLTEHAKGIQVNSYTYDSNLRFLTNTRVEGKLSRTVKYAWDEATSGFFNLGKLTSIVDGNASIKLDYNIDGLITNKTWKIGDSSYPYVFGYFPGNFAKSLVYPDKSNVKYTYGDSGELSSFQYSPAKAGIDNEATVSFSQYGINSSPEVINYGSSVKLNLVFDGWGRSLKSVFSDGKTPLSTISYEWDNTGNIVSKSRDANKTVYTYDSLNRLVGSKGDSLDLKYKYDANNNLLQNGSNTFVIDTKSNRLATGIIGTKKIAFKHDALGRLLGDGEETYSYGDSGRLESIVNGSVTTKIGYFNHNKLTHDTTTYLDNGFQIIDAGYLKRLQAFNQTWESVNSDGTINYIFPDRLRSNLMTVDSKTLKPTSSFEYEPYGAAHVIK